MTPLQMRCYHPPPAQHSHDVAHHDRADIYDARILTSYQIRFVPALGNSFLHTLAAVLEWLNRLVLLINHVHGASASFLKRFDVCALQVQSPLFINVTHNTSYSHCSGRARGGAIHATNLPNAPPPRPAPNPYPTGPNQDGILRFATTLSGPKSDLRSRPYCSCYRKANNKPPPRPATTPYPTGPHQSSTKHPNEPPPRPAPNPYPTGPHQS
jgi:hypothetical protein